jgi:DNA polymerase I-like protein with 3'-5' exonuclease and polymerase domains
MPLINVDAKALEWMCATWLSKDEVAIQEWKDGVDLHSVNQEHFKLPTRLIAKTYLFRLIYGGSAYAYANDPLFMEVSDKVEYWQDVIDKTYAKYSGLHQYHENLLLEAMSTGKVVMPTGRTYYFQPQETRRGPEWPRTQILNYPVQGLGADIMMLARTDLFYMCRRYFPNIKFRGTVHDSIILDTSPEYQEFTIDMIRTAWKRLPTLFEAMFYQPFNLDCRCEVSVGNNLKEMEEVK